MIKNFFTSNMNFDNSSIYIKSRYQMVNLGILLSSLSLIYGIFLNILRGTPDLIPMEVLFVFINITLFFLLRKNEKSFEYVTTFLTAQFTFFFLFLIYVSEPSELKHVWIYTYPITLLYFQKNKAGYYWFALFFTLLIIAPLQNVVEVHYSGMQISYIAFVLLIIYGFIHFFQSKMNEAKGLILEQKNTLRSKIEELEKKDQILSLQSKQAVMGEMISMIAHQWRQPLSTITLQISNLEIKKLLGEEVSDKESAETLSQISSTIVYLSDTIDDFQTYFQPNKEPELIGIYEVLQKSSNFILPRLKGTRIDLDIQKEDEIELLAHSNELIQVILNILNNAIDSLVEMRHDDGKISITIVNLGSDIEVIIKDNASGISDEHLPYLFEPYFSTKGKNGTGLGLYMSQMIIQKQFSGSISVKTSTQGSSFVIKIPKEV